VIWVRLGAGVGRYKGRLRCKPRDNSVYMMVFLKYYEKLYIHNNFIVLKY